MSLSSNSSPGGQPPGRGGGSSPEIKSTRGKVTIEIFGKPCFRSHNETTQHRSCPYYCVFLPPSNVQEALNDEYMMKYYKVCWCQLLSIGRPARKPPNYQHVLSYSCSVGWVVQWL